LKLDYSKISYSVHAKQNEPRKKEHSSASDPHTHAEKRRTQSSSGNLEGLFFPVFLCMFVLLLMTNQKRSK